MAKADTHAHSATRGGTTKRGRSHRRTASQTPPKSSSHSIDAHVDATLADSFPASDPPEWTYGRTVWDSSHDAPTDGDRAIARGGQEAMIDPRPTARFRAEHKEVQVHLRHVHQWVGALSTQRAVEQRKTAQRVAAFFEEHIRPHAAWEERFLYPVVDKLTGGGPNAFTSTMRYEHRVVDRWIGELRAEADRERIDAERFSRRTDNLLGLLWAHFEEEEEVLLPFVEKGMSKEQFERVLGPGADARE